MFKESMPTVLPEPENKNSKSYLNNIDRHHHSKIEAALEKIDQLSLDVFNFANNEIFPPYFWESIYDKGIEISFYKDFISNNHQKEFENDLCRTTSNEQYQIKTHGQGNDSGKNNNFITYESLWKKYNIAPQFITKKYADFINEYLINNINPYLDYEQQKDGIKKLNKNEWTKININTTKIERWIKKQNDLRDAKINAQETLATLFSLNVPNEVVHKIFEKYSKIIQLSDNISNNLLEYIKTTNEVGTNDVLEIRSNLVYKANQILGDFKKNMEEQLIFPEELLDKLEQVKGEITLFKSIFMQIAKEHPKIAFDYFKSLELTSQKGEEVTEDDKKAMTEIMAKNYPDINERYVALAGLDKGLHNQGTVFEILRYKGEIVSFLRFDRHYDEQGTPTNSYFGSFNTDSDFQGAVIGEAMIKECLNKEAEDFVVEAHCFSDKRISSKYIEDAGFIAETIELNYLNTGKCLLKITRDDKTNEQYKYRSRFESDIKKELEVLAENFTGSAIGKPFLKIEVDKLSDSAVLEKIKLFMEKHDLVITRYFPDNKKIPKYFVMIFEKKIPKPKPSAYIA